MWKDGRLNETTRQTMSNKVKKHARTWLQLLPWHHCASRKHHYVEYTIFKHEKIVVLHEQNIVLGKRIMPFQVNGRLFSIIFKV